MLEKADHGTPACIRCKREVSRGLFPASSFFPAAQLEIIHYVYEVPQLEARDPFRDRDHDWVRQVVLRKQIMDSVGQFDDKVLRNMPENWATFTAPGIYKTAELA